MGVVSFSSSLPSTQIKMAIVWSSIHGRNDMQKSINLLISKATQIIVQSRLGMKIKSPCKLYSSGADSFNLAVQDLPEVNTEVKKALLNNVQNTHVSLCVEISLKTVENGAMILETWFLCTTVSSALVTFVSYNRMCILLKSLISVTRVTPAYKLSRRQCNESYTICYNIYTGKPHLHHLGENPQKIALGQLETKFGRMELTVWYRTKMTISTEQSRQEMLMLKCDHFYADLNSRNLEQQNKASKSLTKSIKAGAFVNTCREQSAWSLIIEDIPFLDLIESGPPPPSPPASRVTPAPPLVSASCPVATENLQLGERKEAFEMINADDLGTFYWECRCAPQLISLTGQTTLAEQVESINKFLQALESKIQDYDDMLHLLSSSGSFNNNFSI